MVAIIVPEDMTVEDLAWGGAITTLKLNVEKLYGERCSEFYCGCASCMAYLGIEILESVTPDLLKMENEQKEGDLNGKRRSRRSRGNGD